jgi:DNA topoisomerase-1
MGVETAVARSPSQLIERARRSGSRRKATPRVSARTVGRELAKMLGDTEASATSVGLRQVSADEPGYHRRKRGRGFAIVDASGRPVKDRHVLTRVARLAIPPAWTDVWICRTDDGHLQAHGRDARGRKQYRYHPEFRAVRDAAKYEHMRDFCRALPKLREKIESDLACRCLCKEKVVATVVALIERAHLRVGSDEYTKSNGSYGATTLEGRHAKVIGSLIELTYRGKSGKRRAIRFRDARIAKVIRQCKALRGRRLFRWRKDGRVGSVTSADVNAYVHLHAGPRFTAKDFRTWAATIAAAIGLAREDEPASPTARKRVAADVVKSVAMRLGNTPAVCRKSYVHPLLIDRYVGAQLGVHMKRLARLTSGASALDPRAMQRVETEVFDMLL